jgi:hypothetical protein
MKKRSKIEPWNKGVTGYTTRWKGRHHSEESKKIMSIKKIGAYSGKDNPFYGKHHTKETKQILSKKHLGKHLSDEHKMNIRLNSSKNMLGKHLSPETKQKLREINLGKHHTDETKQKISAKLKGKFSGDKHPMWGKHHSDTAKMKMSKRMSGEKNPRFGMHCSDVTKQKISKTHLGKKLSDEHKRKISENNTRPMLGKHHTEESKNRMSLSHVGKCHTEETKKKMSLIQKGKSNLGRFKKNQLSWIKGKTHSDLSRKKMSISQKNHFLLTGGHSEEYKKMMRNKWKDEKFAKGMFEKIHAKPNGQELYLDFILQNNFPDEWMFVGDGGLFIQGLCPDFINVNGKKQIIELFGEHWHRGENVKYNKTEDGRKEIFSQINFDTLIIWDYELKDETKVIEKIRRFSE